MRPASIVASVFGIGYFPAAQGTIMSAIATPLAVLIMLKGGGIVLACASAIAFTIGVFACDEHMRETGRADPPECVIDELAGQWFACAFVPSALALPAFALAFVLFRLFDIWKPWPIRQIERLPGGWGVMLDDMAAGLAAGVLVAFAHVAHLV